MNNKDISKIRLRFSSPNSMKKFNEVSQIEKLNTYNYKKNIYLAFQGEASRIKTFRVTQRI